MMRGLPRRKLLRMGLAMAASPCLPPLAHAGAGDGGDHLFLSAASQPDGSHWVRGFVPRRDGLIEALAHRLPGRAHHIAVSQAAGLYVVVARRPDTFLVVGDLTSGKVLRQLRTPPGRHLFGHGVFAADGSRFYAVESDYEDRDDNGRVVGWVFSRQGEQLGAERVSDFPSHGVGPHELHLMPDGETLVVANGGIRTHPDSGREKLNLDSMRPSLVYLNRHSGELLEQRRLAPEYHQASIRHLDVNGEGLVALVMQYQGQPFEQVPLVALHNRGGPIRFPEVPAEVQRRMAQYCGSVRFDAAGRRFAVSCPRGSMLTFWDAREERYLEQVAARDGCGVCAWGEGFVYTAGTGRIHYHRPGEVPREFPHEFGRLFWDNHLSLAKESS